MGGGGVRRGYAKTSRTRGAKGDGMERGVMKSNGAMRGGVTGRWEAAA
jgi:hypothetical protein